MNRNKNSTWSDGNDNQRDEEGTLKTQREGSQCVCVCEEWWWITKKGQAGK